MMRHFVQGAGRSVELFSVLTFFSMFVLHARLADKLLFSSWKSSEYLENTTLR